MCTGSVPGPAHPSGIRHVLFDALGIGGRPPGAPIKFDALLKDVLAERLPSPCSDPIRRLI
jgi:hypothetical protein